jgi:DNA-binding MurR/RpiR family transcriptional regulator
MFREKISAIYKDLSPSYQRVAEFVLDHYHEVAFLTATQLASRLGVDAATVVRCCQRLGYDGYPELLQDVRATVREEIQRMISPTFPTEGMVGRFRAALDSERTNLERLQSQFSDEQVEELLNAFSAAGRVFVMGHWLGAQAARLFADWMTTLGRPTQFVELDPVSISLSLRDLGQGDLIVGLILYGPAEELATIFDLAKRRGAMSVAISNSRSAPAARSADLVITYPGESIDKAPSYGSLFTLLSVLINSLAPQGWASVKDAADQGHEQLLNASYKTLRDMDVYKSVEAEEAAQMR